jgi:hypothetical protein
MKKSNAMPARSTAGRPKSPNRRDPKKIATYEKKNCRIRLSLVFIRDVIIRCDSASFRKPAFGYFATAYRSFGALISEFYHDKRFREIHPGLSGSPACGA